MYSLNSYIYSLPSIQKINHTLLNRVFHRTFSSKYDVHQEIFGTRASCSRVWGLLPLHIFKLLVLAAESLMQIYQVNCVVILQQKIIMRVNELCSVTSGKN
jgi:hypothetical protein